MSRATSLSSRIEGQIAGFLGKREQTFQRSDRAVLAGRLETSLPYMFRPSLKIGERDPGDGFFHERQEAGRLGVLVPVRCDGRNVVAVTDQIRAVAKQRLHRRMGELSTEDLKTVEQGVREVLKL